MVTIIAKMKKAGKDKLIEIRKMEVLMEAKADYATKRKRTRRPIKLER
jgi:hypothetical protein